MKKYSYKLIIEYFIIFLISILLIFIYTNGNINIFLTDDNYSEFYPVIEQSYNTLFKEGHLPVYDFYQMNGMLICDQGYYAQTNPLMLVSYIIEHLTNMHLNCISIYICIAFALGNVLTYILLRKLNIHKLASFLAVSMLAISTCLFYYSYWYHIFGNSIAIPIILLSILFIIKNNNNIFSYFISGICLAFSLILGNIQYTFYHYILFGIIMCVLAFAKKDTKYIVFLISNAIFAIFLSSPILFIQLSAGNRRTASINFTDYFLYNINLIPQFIYSLIPFFFVKDLNFVDPNYSTFLDLGYGYLFSGISLILLIVYIIYIINNLVNYNNKQKSFFKNDKNIFVFAIFCVILFFIWWALGQKWILAKLLYFIPGVKNFRHLHKLTFIFTLLFPIISGYILDKFINSTDKNLTKIKYIVVFSTITYFFIGIFNMRYILNSGVNNFFYGEWTGDTNLSSHYKDIPNYLDKNNIDKNNYRILGFLEKLTDANDEWCHYEDTRDNCLYNFSKNLPTLIETYSIGGYDTALMENSYSQCDNILFSKTFSFSFTNGVSSYHFFNLYDKYVDLINDFENDMIHNSIKYVSFRKNSSYLNDFQSLISKTNNLEIINKYDLSDNQILFELNNIDSLCTNQSNEKIDINGTIDRVYINIPDNQNIENLTLRFTYYDNIKAYYLSDSGKKIFLELDADDNGYIVLNNISDLKNKTITLYYSYPLAQISFIASYLVFIVLISIPFILIRFNIKEENILLLSK